MGVFEELAELDREQAELSEGLDDAFLHGDVSQFIADYTSQQVAEYAKSGENAGPADNGDASRDDGSRGEGEAERTPSGPGLPPWNVD